MIHEVRKLRAHFLTILLLISSRVGLTQPSLTEHTKAASGTQQPFVNGKESKSSRTRGADSRQDSQFNCIADKLSLANNQESYSSAFFNA